MSNKVKIVMLFFTFFLFIGNFLVKAENMIISGYSYDDIGPYIIFFNMDKNEYTKKYLNQVNVNMKCEIDRYCIGTYDLHTFESSPCQYHNKLAYNSKINNCDLCYNKIGFNPAFYNSSNVSPQQKEYNNTPHVVYLAYFSPSCIKVGIASQKRIRLRLLEQGALGAFVLKTFTDAYKARNLETKISHSGCGIVESVTRSQKIDIFCKEKYDSKLAEATLFKYLKILDIKPESLFLDLMSSYFYGKSYKFNYTDKSMTSSSKISGEAVGMIGDMIIIKKRDKFFPIDIFYPISLKNFISHKVTF